MTTSNEKSLIAKAAEVIRERWDPSSRMEWAEQHARAVVAAVRDQIAAEALREAADEMEALDAYEIHAEAYDWLRARAEALGATESAGEGENGGRSGREAVRGCTGETGEEA